jgi:hypothetical protein
MITSMFQLFKVMHYKSHQNHACPGNRQRGHQCRGENQRHQGFKSTQIDQIQDKIENHYDCLEIDEFWTYVGKKKNQVWLIYAYHRESGEIVAFVWVGEEG